MNKSFVERVAACDIEAADLVRMRTSIVYGRIITKEERIEINTALGCLRDILYEARKTLT